MLTVCITETEGEGKSFQKKNAKEEGSNVVCAAAVTGEADWELICTHYREARKARGR